MAFFANDQEGSCKDSDTSNALVLTTSSVPRAYTCFNVTDIFSQSNNSGFQNDTSLIWDHGPDPVEHHPPGIAWLLQNQDAFDSKANYTRVWYEQVNQTGEIKAGEDGAWVFYTYAFPDCEQVGGDDFELADYPWFETSCQTESGGQCQTVPSPIKSFAIASAAQYNSAQNCEEWAYLGAAARLDCGAAMIAALAAGVAACFVVL